MTSSVSHPKTLALAGEPIADQLLAQDPLALLIGMVLDQQIMLEKAFRGPAVLKQRIGSLDPGYITSLDPNELDSYFCQTPSLHRFPSSMAKRVQLLCQIITNEYNSRADQVWLGAKDAEDLLRRIEALPGFGKQKAKIFIALLAKQFEIRPSSWQEVSFPFGQLGVYLSIADIVDNESLQKVRQYKKDLKAEQKKLVKGND